MYVSNEVIEKMQEGNEVAFNTVYESYKKLLFFIIVSIVKNEENAKDILQDTFIKVYMRCPSLESTKSFHSWICSIARNLSLNYLRDNQKIVPLDDNLLSIYEVQNPQFTYFSDINSYLSDIESIIVFYKIQYDFTFQEIVKLTKIPLSTVYKIYNQALKKVKEHYEEEAR